ncbi:MAG: hypothetical protein GX591_08870 [Planctomycetes bacterium]|nr:hypothetical protein [Planctomycetota bacterium]
MTPRERYIRTLRFQQPDRIPLMPGGPRRSTLQRWSREGLGDRADWWGAVCQAVGVEPAAGAGPVGVAMNSRMIPQFEEKVLEHRGSHLVVQDWKGNVCEISDAFDVSYLRNAIDFVTRRWIRCPVESRDDWERMKARYDPDDPARMPDTLPDADGRPLAVGVNGPFWQMREWCGFEGLCMMMIDDPGLVDDMASFWCGFVASLLERLCERVVPDVLFISEDMAYKVKAMISPAMTRRWCLPSWRRWTDLVMAGGCPLVDMDSDGFVGELIPLWIEAGINVCDPIEVAAGNDLAAYCRQYGRSIAYRMGVDKRAIAAGGAVLAAELDRLAPLIRAGGYIPGCDHGVPSDVSWDNFVDYTGRLAELTGWR